MILFPSIHTVPVPGRYVVICSKIYSKKKKQGLGWQNKKVLAYLFFQIIEILKRIQEHDFVPKHSHSFGSWEICSYLFKDIEDKIGGLIWYLDHVKCLHQFGASFYATRLVPRCKKHNKYNSPVWEPFWLN